MATANQEHQSQLRQLAELILAVCGRIRDRHETDRPGAGFEIETTG